MNRFLTALVVALFAATVAHSQGLSSGPAAPVPSSNLDLAVTNDAMPAPGPGTAQVCPGAADCGMAAPRCWATAEYLFWSIGTGKLLELGKAAYQSDLFNALLDASGKNYRDLADTLLGNDRTGFRVAAGGWLDDDRTVGVEAGFLYVDRGPLVLNLGRRDLNPLERLLSNKQVVLDPRQLNHPLAADLLLRRIGLPAIDGTGRMVIIPFGRRDLANGSVTFEIADQTLWVLDLGGRARLFESDGLTADGLIGYRRAYFRDSLAVRSETLTLVPPLLPGTRLQSIDSIQAENTYDGVLLGVDVATQMGSWTLSVRPTATIAAYRSEVTQDAVTTVAVPNDRPRLIRAGTYLRGSDIGTFTTTGWTVLPEIGLRASRGLGNGVRFTLGASLLYLSDAARAGPQLDLGLDPARVLPGAVGTLQARNLNPPVIGSTFLSTLSVGLEITF